MFVLMYLENKENEWDSLFEMVHGDWTSNIFERGSGKRCLWAFKYILCY